VLRLSQGLREENLHCVMAWTMFSILDGPVDEAFDAYDRGL
jgi:hypothetical protein